MDRFIQFSKEMITLLNDYNHELSSLVKQMSKVPSARITWGYEREFAFDKPKSNEFKGRATLPVLSWMNMLHFHRDWAYVYEMSSPVMVYQWPPRLEDLATMAVIEAIAAGNGFLVSEYSYDFCCEGDERTCGAHIHFKSTPLTAAKIHNWLVFLTPLIAPALVLGRKVRIESDEPPVIFSQSEYEYRFRFMLWHYAAAPRYISRYEINDAESMPGAQFRGYDVDRDNNAFYIIEINKYRKAVWTIEYRINEQHPLVTYFILDVASQLADKRVPVVNVAKYYDRNNIPVDYAFRVPATILIPWIKDNWLRELIGDTVTIDKFAEKLLTLLKNPNPVTEKVLEKFSRGKRPLYTDYLRWTRETIEEHYSGKPLAKMAIDLIDKTLEGVVREVA